MDKILDCIFPNWPKRSILYVTKALQLNYLKKNKPKSFEKLLVMSIFTNVKFLIKRLQSAIISTQDI